MKIAVTSPSFSKNPVLIEEVRKIAPEAKLNDSGIRLKGEALYEFIKDADTLIVGLEQMDEALLSRLPDLKMIAKYGVGLNNVDLEYCEKRGISIGWKGGVNRLSVAEMTLGFMLMLCRNLYYTSNQLKSGTWNKSGGFQLSGKTIGLLGIGFVGKEVVKLLQPFNCRILVNDIRDQSDYYYSHDLIEKSKTDIYKEADIISLHMPLDELNHNLINKEAFAHMKESAFVINTARGGIINEEDLKEALLTGRLAGAAIDAYETEPPEDKKLLEIPNLITTPHIGGNSREAVEAMGMSAINEVKKFYHIF